MEVSVIIPVYNAARFVSQAVESALSQPETGQILLIEDGSSDGSLAICQDLSDRYPNINLLRHHNGENRGAAASRNLGLRAVRCEYTAFLDADDYYLPDRFRIARRIFEEDPSIDGVYEAVGTVYENEKVKRWYLGRGRHGLTTITKSIGPDHLFEALLAGRWGFFCTDGIVARTRLFQATGEFDTSLRMCEDTAMWIKMSAVGRLVPGSITEPVSIRRLHSGNNIYRNHDRNKTYAVMMAQSLLRWGHEHQLPKARLIRLLDALLRFRLAAIGRESGYLRRKLQESRCLAGLAMGYPFALQSGYYWHVLGYTIGWRRCREVCCLLCHR